MLSVTSALRLAAIAEPGITRRLKGLCPQLRYPQLDLAGLGLQLAFVMPGSALAASLGALVTLSIAQSIRLGV